MEENDIYGGREMVSEHFSQVDAQIHRDAIVDLMRGLQSFQSFPPDEAACMAYLANWLQGHGLQAELIDVSDEPGRPDLVCRLQGSGGGRTLMFNGHLDIDPVPMNYPGDPWKCYEETGRLYGHGLANMKAGIAAMSAATVAILRAGAPVRGDVLLTAVVGELQGGVGAVDLVERGIFGDCAIIGEPTSLLIETQHASAIEFLIHTLGSSEWVGALHSHKAVNAVEKLGTVIDELKDIRFEGSRRAEG
jgi:acetylornithine deacetylase